MTAPYYQDELVTLYHGDCRGILPTLPDASIDLIFTDPPYGHNNNNGDLAHRWEAALGLLPSGSSAPEARAIANDGPEANDLVRFAFGEARRLLKPGCCCCCCGGGGGPDPQFARWSLWLDEAVGFKQAVVWDKGGKGCGAETHMGLALCETYARDPGFYGATYCAGCSMHRPVAEFVWVEDGKRVGS